MSSIEVIGVNLEVCWEFFKMCEPCLVQFYPKEIYARVLAMFAAGNDLKFLQEAEDAFLQANL